ncbi:MAG TPA: hypothetical protein VGG48_02715 [Rhizomicrobium sp.]|jgi:hypothetical protein
MGFRAALVCVALFTSAAWGDDAPKIRDFDIPTVENLGQAIYQQDQEAWKATDVLNAQYSLDQLKAEKLHGWVVDTAPGRDVVRFVRDGASGPEVLCDVTFTPDIAQSCVVPPSLALAPPELAQYAARTLALKNIERPCSNRYNTVVLKDPERDGWLVWALAATEEPGVIVYGGHYRFTVSADGNTIIERDALSRACLNIGPPDPSKGAFVASMFVQLVSNVPVETTVWLNLLHKHPFYLITPDRAEWSIENGHISRMGTLPDKK